MYQYTTEKYKQVRDTTKVTEALFETIRNTYEEALQAIKKDMAPGASKGIHTYTLACIHTCMQTHMKVLFKPLRKIWLLEHRKVYIHTCMNTYMYVYTYEAALQAIKKDMGTGASKGIHTYILACMHTCMRTHTKRLFKLSRKIWLLAHRKVYIHTYLHACIHAKDTYIHVCICIHACMHTHTHIKTLLLVH